VSDKRRRWKPARSDYFARLPFRIDQALATGDLTFDQAAVLVLLAVRIQRAGTIGVEESGSPEVAFTLRGLKDALAWEKSPDTLGRVLHSLRKGGWIAFPEVTQGQRKPYVISLAGAAIDGTLEAAVARPMSPTSAPLPHHFGTGDPSGAEVTSAVPKSEAPSNPLPERDPAGSPPPQCRSPREEIEKETQPSLTLGLSRRPQKARTDEGGKSDEAEPLPLPEGNCSECDHLGPLVALTEEDEPRVCERCAWSRMSAAIGREMP
jgi:hypothetical protein